MLFWFGIEVSTQPKPASPPSGGEGSTVPQPMIVAQPPIFNNSSLIGWSRVPFVAGCWLYRHVAGTTRTSKTCVFARHKASSNGRCWRRVFSILVMRRPRHTHAGFNKQSAHRPGRFPLPEMFPVRALFNKPHTNLRRRRRLQLPRHRCRAPEYAAKKSTWLVREIQQLHGH